MAKAAIGRTAIFLKELPYEYYNDVEILGRGATSLVVKESDETAMVFTRDLTKSDWLCNYFGLNMGDWIDEYDSSQHPNPDLNVIPIQMIRMPVLFPLSQENKKFVRKERKDLCSIWDECYFKSVGKKRDNSIMADVASRTLEAIEKKFPNNIFSRFLSWATNYYDWDLDIHMGNFAQTADGKVVVLDPVVNSTLMYDLYK